MLASSITKYHFRIRTRTGAIVENVAIFGKSEDEAGCKLRQMYKDCEILDCQLVQSSVLGRGNHLNYEDVVDLIISA
ncbi:hypothetical protein KI614_05035 [Dechloromonas denitrificans]|jgi:hypothetical protein|uniref:hypothetical protein n=1 Tax=Dechloromonas denitrificans TaxID=281362 RepID=UPI001CF88B1E|nr:hypothetical protein [Dechloromonas denitrificans]UCV12582.1 hypothetical protein KI614_05035 [Dechloromonas denitrificans]